MKNFPDIGQKVKVKNKVEDFYAGDEGVVENIEEDGDKPVSVYFPQFGTRANYSPWDLKKVKK